MALRRNQESSKKMGVENHDVTKKSQQTSLLPLATQRRALNEIGNVVKQRNVEATACVKVAKGSSSTPSKLRRSTRLSSRYLQPTANQPKKVTRVKELPGADEVFVQPQSKVRVMGPPKAPVPTILNRSESSSGLARRTVVPKRAPRLTLKPPAVETPPEQRLAAQNLIRQSLAAERNRRCSMTMKTSFAVESQPSSVMQDIKEAASKPNAKKKEIPEIPIKDDIDLAHSRCFWMMSTYSKKLYAYLQNLDRKMASKLGKEQLKSIKETTRSKLVEWMASAHLQLDLLQETFQLGVSILDRYLLRVKHITETRYELVAMTCLSLGIKYEELLTNLVKELLSLSSRPYTMKEYIEMEAEVMRELGFQIARPIPLVFLRRYSTAAKCDRTQHSYGKYLIDLAQLDFNLVRLPSSSLAAAATFIVITLRALQVNPEIWEPVMLHYTTVNFNEIKPIVSRMAMLVLPGGPHCRSLRRKYASEVSYFSSEGVQHLLLALHDMSYA